MKLTFTTILAFCLIYITTSGISMLNVKIGDSQSDLKNIKLEVFAEENDMIKYITSDGNHFSVTSENGKIVYFENDWLHNPKSATPLVSNFKFGKTSLKDIRKKFGTNGFCYSSRAGGYTTETDLIQFNCFEIDSKNNEVLVLITRVPLDANVDENNVAQLLKLEAIIISNKEYLDKTWGEEKVYDKNYKKINL